MIIVICIVWLNITRFTSDFSTVLMSITELFEPIVPLLVIEGLLKGFVGWHGGDRERIYGKGCGRVDGGVLLGLLLLLLWWCDCYVGQFSRCIVVVVVGGIVITNN